MNTRADAASRYHIDLDVPTHKLWDASIPPVLRVSAGDFVQFRTQDFAGGQITPDSTHADVAALDFGSIYPLAGPVFVDGAEPGDALALEVVEIKTADWGWACIIPGLGVLPESEFADPYLKHFDLSSGTTTSLCPGVSIPIEPFLGTIGVCPEGARGVPVPPPHAGGGNIDIRHVVAGSTLLLPVFEPGGLLSVGDAHAAQGDGEVAISGIECACTCTLRIGVHKGDGPKAPRLYCPPGSLTRRMDSAGWQATFGIGPDLHDGAREAVRRMVQLLHEDRGLSREDAYILCSLAADLKINELVDAPNWIVGCFLPDAVLTSP